MLAGRDGDDPCRGWGYECAGVRAEGPGLQRWRDPRGIGSASAPFLSDAGSFDEGGFRQNLIGPCNGEVDHEAKNRGEED